LSEVIDVHSHLYPRRYVERLKRRRRLPRFVGERGSERFRIFPEEERQQGGRTIGPEFWEPDLKLLFMDRYGIDRTVVSLGNPWLDPIGPKESVSLARGVNRDFDAMAARTRGRLVGLGVLPNDVPAAVHEVAWAKQQTELRGFISGPHLCGFKLDRTELEPLWVALESSGLTLFVHPAYAAFLSELEGYGHMLPVAIGFPTETTVALVRMAVAGVLDRHPRLKILAAHGGGTVPFLAGRIDAGVRSDDFVGSQLSRLPSEALRTIYMDALVYHPRALRALADLVGEGHMAFGTDHPFGIADPARNLDAIRATFSRAQTAAVLETTAIDLFDL